MAKPVATKYTTSWRMQSPHPNPDEVQRRLEQLVSAWVGKTKTGDEVYEKAFKEALKAFLKTPSAKKLIDVLTNNKVLPITLFAMGAGLTGMLSQGKDFPSPPDIPIGGGMKIKFQLKGNVQKLQGVMIGFEMPLGVARRAEKATSARFTHSRQLPREIALEIDKALPDDKISSWVIKQAKWEYETAGPDEEEAKLRVRRRAETDAQYYSDRLLAKGVAIKILDSAQHNGTDAQVFLGSELFWNELTEFEDLFPILKKITETVAKLLDKNRTGSVKRVTFLRRKKGSGSAYIPVPIL